MNINIMKMSIHCTPVHYNSTIGTTIYIYISTANRKKRLQFAIAHQNYIVEDWIVEDWKNVT